MFRTKNRRDANEKEIVDAIEGIGAVVERLSGSAGLPDLLVGYKGQTRLAEIKDPARDGSRSKECIRLDRLDASQCEWFARWKGSTPFVWTSPEQALRDLAELG